ncbi:Zn-dependent protease with chaperone function [Streptomyces prasinopilosus]|uniref:Zn-dependent protease with chaperone function n=1 Tax=Streptomyces prasinopilosus TaxID=67344 RepID=A0A1G6JTV2_9ACTN|nr:M48 family metallopeptidase [Streptomyces prasinopilosus]SDC22127.1 Zn-dependent protease with chaperone function [Streptomyces prasinopilosus]
MRSATGETTRPCPQCGAGIRADNRFVDWCAACDWNVDPAGPEERPERLERMRRALARRHGEKLLAEVTTGGTPSPGRDAPALLAQAIALGVHGVTLALTAGGIWWVVSGWGGAGMVPGLFLLALAWPLRPRLPGLPEEGPLLHRAEAPELYALIDEVARVAGTRGVDVIAVDAEANAAVTTYGVRGRRLLVLGLPLWEILTPRQRIALLGHELGHYGHGDVRHGLVVGTAYRSLTTWRYYFTPIADPTPGEMVVNLFYVVPYSLLQGVLMLLDQLTLRAAQRAEYLADSVAARAGSTEAAVGLMDRLLVADSAAAVLRIEANRVRAARRGGRRTEDREGELWEHLAARMDAIPEHEYERRRRAGVLRGHSVDSTHPPTHLRRECLLAGGSVPAAVAVDGERERRIAAELADARSTVARKIVRDGFDG